MFGKGRSLVRNILIFFLQTPEIPVPCLILVQAIDIRGNLDTASSLLVYTAFAYVCVLFISLCPISSFTVIRLAPFANNINAKLQRAPWNDFFGGLAADFFSQFEVPRAYGTRELVLLRRPRFYALSSLDSSGSNVMLSNSLFLLLLTLGYLSSEFC